MKKVGDKVKFPTYSKEPGADETDTGKIKRVLTIPKIKGKTLYWIIPKKMRFDVIYRTEEELLLTI